MPVEASGDLLALAYMYPKATGALCGRCQLAPTRLFSKNMRTTLESNGLYIPTRLSTTDGPGPLAGQTRPI